jgi:hypothetical protein
LKEITLQFQQLWVGGWLVFDLLAFRGMRMGCVAAMQRCLLLGDRA